MFFIRRRRDFEVEGGDNLLLLGSRVLFGRKDYAQLVIIELVILEVVQVLAPGSLGEVVASQVQNRVVRDLSIDVAHEELHVRHNAVVSFILGLSLVKAQNGLLEPKTVVVFLLEEEGRFGVAVVGEVHVDLRRVDQVEGIYDLLLVFQNRGFGGLVERGVEGSVEVVDEIVGDCPERRGGVVDIDSVVVEGKGLDGGMLVHELDQTQKSELNFSYFFLGDRRGGFFRPALDFLFLERRLFLKDSRKGGQ